VLWVLVDVLLVLAGLVFLAVLALGLWRKVRDLGREVGRAGEVIGRATDQLAELQAQRPDLFPDDRRVG
jgi:hypothetical protein